MQDEKRDFGFASRARIVGMGEKKKNKRRVVGGMMGRLTKLKRAWTMSRYHRGLFGRKDRGGYNGFTTYSYALSFHTLTGKMMTTIPIETTCQFHEFHRLILSGRLEGKVSSYFAMIPPHKGTLSWQHLPEKMFHA